MSKKESLIWYFAYGSNMTTKVLSGRRKVYPQKSIPGKARDYQLTFNLFGFPYLEPSFGNIRLIKTNEKELNNSITPLITKSDFTKSIPVEGVLHLITFDEYNQIRYTEGGNGHDNLGYQDIELTIETYDQQLILARTLIANSEMSWRNEARPSKRYLNLLKDGAKEFNLSSDYQHYLDSLPYYQFDNNLQLIGKWFMIILVLPLFLPFLLCYAVALRTGSQPPLWIAKWNNMINRFIWTLYDSVLKPIFGNGE